MKRFLLSLAFLLATSLMLAQSPYRIEVAAQDIIRLPWGFKNLTVVDGNLYGYSDGVMVRAAATAGYMYALQPDTLSHFVGKNFDYIVRNPLDGQLYFTCKEKDGHYALYTHSLKRRGKNQQVELRAWHKGVFHPTFSPDGTMMVFTASGKIGLGGYDLWCSFWNGKRWSKPMNMGNVINGPGNEICPVFYGNYLIYASDSVQNSEHGYNFYSVKIKPGTKQNNLLFDTFKVQRLPFPVNSDSSDVELAVDTVAHVGYWLTNRSGKKELYGYRGNLEGVLLTGYVSDDKGRPVKDADVRVLVDGRVVCATTTSQSGAYSLLVQPGDDYILRVSCQNYFTSQAVVSAVRRNEDFLIAVDRHDVKLSYLPFNRILVFDHIYPRGLDVELSEHGKSMLLPVIDFVRDNPGVKMQLSVVCNQTDNPQFNNMVIDHRISDLRNFLISVLPSEGQFLLKNGNEEAENTASSKLKNAILITLLKDDN